MQHEKIIKRPSGNQMKIDARISIPFLGERPIYSVFVYYRLKGKIKWQKVAPVEMQFGEEYDAEELLEAKLELWGKLKPKN